MWNAALERRKSAMATFTNLLRALLGITSDERFGFTERERWKLRRECDPRNDSIIFLYNCVEHRISVTWRNRNRTPSKKRRGFLPYFERERERERLDSERSKADMKLEGFPAGWGCGGGFLFTIDLFRWLWTGVRSVLIAKHGSAIQNVTFLVLGGCVCVGVYV